MGPDRSRAVLRRLMASASRMAPALLIALAAVYGAVPDGAGAATGGAAPAPSVSAGSRYLALGDSVSFGYEEGGVVPAPK